MLQIIREGRQRAKSGSCEGQDYWTFTIRFAFQNGFLDVIGWQYYPNTGELGAPKISKGKNRPASLSAWLVGALFEDVRQQVQSHFVDFLKVCPTPWEPKALQLEDLSEDEQWEEAIRKEIAEATGVLEAQDQGEIPKEHRDRWEMLACANGLKGAAIEEFIQDKWRKQKRRQA